MPRNEATTHDRGQDKGDRGYKTAIQNITINSTLIKITINTGRGEYLPIQMPTRLLIEAVENRLSMKWEMEN